MVLICQLLKHSNFRSPIVLSHSVDKREKRGKLRKMGFGGQIGLKPGKIALKNIFIDRKTIADSRNFKFQRFSQFLADFLTLQK